MVPKVQSCLTQASWLAIGGLLPRTASPKPDNVRLERRRSVRACAASIGDLHTRSASLGDLIGGTNGTIPGTDTTAGARGDNPAVTQSLAIPYTQFIVTAAKAVITNIGCSCREAATVPQQR